MKEAIEQVPVKFWDYSSGKATINQAKLYDYLHKKGYRYYQDSVKDLKYIVLVQENTVSVLIFRLYRLCCMLVDRDFGSFSEEERSSVKQALKEGKDTIKKRMLGHMKFQELDSILDSPSKKLLMALNKSYADKKVKNETSTFHEEI